MTQKLILLPLPQQVIRHSGTYTLPEIGRIALNIPNPATMFPTARRIWAALYKVLGTQWQIAGGHIPAALTLAFDTDITHPQGYRLDITPDGIHIAGRDAPGLFYGVMTFEQLLQTQGRVLPQLTITDWPDFSVRGVMLDISRDKVPTMETLYRLVDRLAGWKVNQFQLYTEHTFAYHKHRVVWEQASPMTAEQILKLDAYCREVFIELVPNQNSFGHMHRWFKHAQYLPLAEVEHEFESPWGSMFPPFSLSPAVPEALDLIDELYDELLPNFTSRMFNVGCDETFDLGLGKSKELVEQQGKGRVYLDFLLAIYERVKARGYTMQFWGDIINQYPDLVPELPQDMIALEWGYEADHDFAGKSKLFADSGIPFYVCPGTSSWRTITGRTDNCIANIRNAVKSGLEHGATGVLNTDWGDEGHWQPLPVSYLGFAYGAALSWAYDANKELNLPLVLDTFVFKDKAELMGRLAYELGNIYQEPGILLPNSSLLFVAYSSVLAEIRQYAHKANAPEEIRALLSDDNALRAKLEATLAAVDRIMEPMEVAQIGSHKVDLLKREFSLAAQMLRHGARRLLFQLESSTITAQEMKEDLAMIIAEYRALWPNRNRPGGLNNSAARLERAGQLYQ